MKYLSLLLVLVSINSFAGGWATSAVPTRIDIERANGFMVYGAFDNAGGCTVSNKFYVKIDHPQYKEIYSTVLAAYMSGKKVQPYIHSCNPVTWYSVESTTYNTLVSAGSLNIMN